MMMHDAWPTSFSQLQQRMTSILFCCWCQVSKTEKSRLLQLTHVAARSFSACCVPTPPSYLVRASNLLHTHPPHAPAVRTRIHTCHGHYRHRGHLRTIVPHARGERCSRTH